MAKNTGKIDIEMHKASLGDFFSIIELFIKMGLDKAMEALRGARNERGTKDSERRGRRVARCRDWTAD